jgi:hypothetical protein
MRSDVAVSRDPESQIENGSHHKIPAGVQKRDARQPRRQGAMGQQETKNPLNILLALPCGGVVGDRISQRRIKHTGDVRTKGTLRQFALPHFQQSRSHESGQPKELGDTQMILEVAPQEGRLDKGGAGCAPPSPGEG